MPIVLNHINWLKQTGKTLVTTEGKHIEMWELEHCNDDKVLSEWAKHFRNHYCLDNEIDYFRMGYGYSRSEYLNEIKFPDKSIAPGPSIRAGDFGEILVSDFLEYLMEYWVPRTRYSDKTVRNESTKGSDIIGFKIINPSSPSNTDELAVFETKTQFSGNKPNERLQDAIDDSIKDQLRKAESLNAIKQRLFYKGAIQEADIITRFQNKEDRPYTEINGAVAIVNSNLIDETMLINSKLSHHPNKDNLILIVISGENLMDLVTELYRRAADEA